MSLSSKTMRTSSPVYVWLSSWGSFRRYRTKKAMRERDVSSVMQMCLGVLLCGVDVGISECLCMIHAGNTSRLVYKSVYTY